MVPTMPRKKRKKKAFYLCEKRRKKQVKVENGTKVKEKLTHGGSYQNIITEPTSHSEINSGTYDRLENKLRQTDKSKLETVTPFGIRPSKLNEAPQSDFNARITASRCTPYKGNLKGRGSRNAGLQPKNFTKADPNNKAMTSDNNSNLEIMCDSLDVNVSKFSKKEYISGGKSNSQKNVIQDDFTINTEFHNLSHRDIDAYIITRRNSDSESSSSINADSSERHLRQTVDQSHLKTVAVNLFDVQPHGHRKDLDPKHNTRTKQIYRRTPFKEISHGIRSCDAGHVPSDSDDSCDHCDGSKIRYKKARILKKAQTHKNTNTDSVQGSENNIEIISGESCQNRKPKRKSVHAKVVSDESSVFSDTEDENEFDSLLVDFDGLQRTEKQKRILNFVDRWYPYAEGDILNRLEKAKSKSGFVTSTIKKLLSQLWKRSQPCDSSYVQEEIRENTFGKGETSKRDCSKDGNENLTGLNETSKNASKIDSDEYSVSSSSDSEDAFDALVQDFNPPGKSEKLAEFTDSLERVSNHVASTSKRVCSENGNENLKGSNENSKNASKIDSDEYSVSSSSDSEDAFDALVQDFNPPGKSEELAEITDSLERVSNHVASTSKRDCSENGNENLKGSNENSKNASKIDSDEYSVSSSSDSEDAFDALVQDFNPPGKSEELAEITDSLERVSNHVASTSKCDCSKNGNENLKGSNENSKNASKIDSDEYSVSASSDSEFNPPGKSEEQTEITDLLEHRGASTSKALPARSQSCNFASSNNKNAAKTFNKRGGLVRETYVYGENDNENKAPNTNAYLGSDKTTAANGKVARRDFNSKKGVTATRRSSRIASENYCQMVRSLEPVIYIYSLPEPKKKTTKKLSRQKQKIKGETVSLTNGKERSRKAGRTKKADAVLEKQIRVESSSNSAYSDVSSQGSAKRRKLFSMEGWVNSPAFSELYVN